MADCAVWGRSLGGEPDFRKAHEMESKTAMTSIFETAVIKPLAVHKEDDGVCARRSENESWMVVQAKAPHHILRVSEHWCEASGYSKEEAIGRSLNFIQGPDTDQTAFSCMMEKVRKGEMNTVTVITYKKGCIPTLTCLETSPDPECNEESKQFVAQVRFSKTLSFKKASEGSGAWLLLSVQSKAHHIDKSSEEFCSLTNMQEQALLSRSLRVLLGPGSNEGALFEQLASCIAGKGNNHSFLLTIYTLQGQPIVCESDFFAVLDPNGGGVSRVRVELRRADLPLFSDVPKRSQESLELVLTAKPPHRIVHTSAAWLTQFGYSVEEVASSNFQLLHGPRTEVGSLAALLRRGILSSSPQSERYVLYSKQGNVVACSMVVSPLLSPSGTIDHLLVRFHVSDSLTSPPTAAELSVLPANDLAALGAVMTCSVANSVEPSPAKCAEVFANFNCTCVPQAAPATTTAISDSNVTVESGLEQAPAADIAPAALVEVAGTGVDGGLDRTHGGLVLLIPAGGGGAGLDPALLSPHLEALAAAGLAAGWDWRGGALLLRVDEAQVLARTRGSSWCRRWAGQLDAWQAWYTRMLWAAGQPASTSTEEDGDEAEEEGSGASDFMFLGGDVGGEPVAEMAQQVSHCGGAQGRLEGLRGQIGRALESCGLDVPVCVLDGGGRVTFASDTLLRELRQGEGEVLGRSLSSLFMDSGDGGLKKFVHALRARTALTGRARALCGDGGQMEVLLCLWPTEVAGEAGFSLSVIGVGDESGGGGSSKEDELEAMEQEAYRLCVEDELRMLQECTAQQLDQILALVQADDDKTSATKTCPRTDAHGDVEDAPPRGRDSSGDEAGSTGSGCSGGRARGSAPVGPGGSVEHLCGALDGLGQSHADMTVRMAGLCARAEDLESEMADLRAQLSVLRVAPAPEGGDSTRVAVDQVAALRAFEQAMAPRRLGEAGLALLDASGAVLWASEGWLTAVGFTREEVLGCKWSGFLCGPGTDGADLARLETSRRRGGGGRECACLRCFHEQGHEVWLQVCQAPAAGLESRWLLSLVDASALLRRVVALGRPMDPARDGPLLEESRRIAALQERAMRAGERAAATATSEGLPEIPEAAVGVEQGRASGGGGGVGVVAAVVSAESPWQLLEVTPGWERLFGFGADDAWGRGLGLVLGEDGWGSFAAAAAAADAAPATGRLMVARALPCRGRGGARFLADVEVAPLPAHPAAAKLARGGRAGVLSVGWRPAGLVGGSSAAAARRAALNRS